MQVSVIIPTYNREAFVVEAIESVLQQTYPSLELMVVDDGSSDTTRARIQPYQNRLHYHYQENRGVSAARNVGLARTSGELVAFLDSDDLWLPTKLAAQVEFMRRTPEAMLCYTDEIWIRRGRRVNPKKKHQKHDGWVFDKTLPLCIISPSSVMIRRRLFSQLGSFDETLPVCEDYDLWIRIAAHYPIHLIPQKLIIKRGGHPDQLSQRSWGNDIYRVQALRKAWHNPALAPGQRDLVARELQTKCRVLATGFRKHGRIQEAEQYAALVRRYQPSLLTPSF